MSEPLLVAEDLRVDVADVPACDGLAFATRGERALVLGAPRALFLATAGQKHVVRGGLRVRGMAPAVAVRERVLAACAIEAPLPPTWTVFDYVTWSARLTGLDKREAKDRAASALASMSLTKESGAELRRVQPLTRRAISFAATLATGAAILALEDPLAGLPEEAALAHAQMMIAALGSRSWIVFASRMPATSPFALAAEEALVMTASRVEAQGSPAAIAADHHRFRARVAGSVDELVRRLAERGVPARIDGTQIVVDLGTTLTTAELFAMCVETEVAVVELVSAARALA